MAVVSGDPITALAVNTCNSSPSYTGSFNGYIQDALGNSGEFWCHKSTGTVISIYVTDGGVFPAMYEVDKYIDGQWVYQDMVMPSSVNNPDTFSSTGRGKYRVTGYSYATSTYSIYCGQTDILPDEEVVCFDSFTSSGNKVNTGQPITAALANATRIGSPKGIV